MRPLTFESIETLSQAEFFEWVEERDRAGDQNRYELLNGRVVMTPPAAWPHGESEVDVLVPIATHVRAHGLGRVFGSSQGFELPSGDTVAGDATFVSNERWQAASPVPGKFLRVVPDLVVEILSPSTQSRDRGEKKAIYERNGVREYWLVDNRARRVQHFVLEGGRFHAGTTFEEDQAVASVVLPGLTVPVRALFPSP
jgi:Uma2 family endonuclease